MKPTLFPLRRTIGSGIQWFLRPVTEAGISESTVDAIKQRVLCIGDPAETLRRVRAAQGEFLKGQDAAKAATEIAGNWVVVPADYIAAGEVLTMADSIDGVRYADRKAAEDAILSGTVAGSEEVPAARDLPTDALSDEELLERAARLVCGELDGLSVQTASRVLDEAALLIRQTATIDGPTVMLAVDRAPGTVTR